METGFSQTETIKTPKVDMDTQTEKAEKEESGMPGFEYISEPVNKVDDEYSEIKGIEDEQS